MNLPVQKFREIVFQLLYSYDLGQPQDEDMIDLMMKELSVTRRSVKMAQERVKDIQGKQSELDALIAQTSQSYNFERIQTVERNVLRLGLFELLYDDDIPAKVAMSEAIRLARKFSTPESAHFINAIMDNLYRNSKGESINSADLQQSIQSLIDNEQQTKEAIERKLQEEKENSNNNEH